MKIRSVFAVGAAVVALSVSTPVYAAAQAHIAVPVHTLYGKTKMVRLSVRNDTNVSLELMIGETPTTLEAGKKIALKLPVGTRIWANAATANHAAGALLSEVTSSLDQATIGIR